MELFLDVAGGRCGAF